MIKINSKKGITLISLVITIVLMLILTSTIVYTSFERFKLNKLQKMISDIKLLSDKVQEYYLKYNEIPVVRDESNNPIEYTYTSLDTILKFDKDINDNEKYYIIDLQAMDNITINYGKEGFEDINKSDDVYVINEASHTIYYVKGIEVNGKTYHLSSETLLSDNISLTKPEIKVIDGEQIKIGGTLYYFKGATLEFVPGTNDTGSNLTTKYIINDGEEKDISTIENNIYQVENSGTNQITLKTIDEGNGKSSVANITIKVINIGDYIDYDHLKDKNGNDVAVQSYTSYATSTASAEKNEGRSSGYSEDQIFNIESYTEGWRVLGIENGQIQLVSADIINPDSGGTLGSSTGKNYYTLRKTEGYKYGVEELNAICSIYGQGKGATDARSINADDINNITGYNPSNSKINEHQINEFGNKVTYYWDGTSTPYYKTANGLADNLTGNHNTRFWWYENNENKIISKNSLKSTTATATDEGREEITTLESTYYNYYLKSLTATNEETSLGMKETSNEWKLLFNNGDYWLASRFVNTASNVAYFGIYRFKSTEKYITTSNLFSSPGGQWVVYQGVRPVVNLSSDIELTEVSENSWKIESN